ncbi:MAG: hypothetical protein G01um101425_791 [Candidatus Peregrinibacteria bacterium Gr01-1014_25]|nr:MAG: hypothetical protein G01um101425_791 [Candidatus Peregrinibacteria bacterium Gr01-1014_25]
MLNEHRLLFAYAARGHATVLDTDMRGSSAKEKEGDDRNPEETRLAQRREHLRTSLFDAFKSRVGMLVTGKDIQAYEKGLAHVKLDEQEIREWERYLLETAPTAAQDMLASLNILLATAGSQIIGPKGKAKWERRFFTLSRPGKKKLLTKELPNWIEKVRGVMSHRRKLTALPRVKTLPEEKVGRIAEFLNADAFIELTLGEQKSLIAEVEAALASKEAGKDTLYDETKNMLEDAAREGHFHPNKIGKWLKHAMTHPRPEEYVGTTLPYFLACWKATAAEFDSVEADVAKAVPRPRLAPKNIFLSWSHAACRAELARVRSALGVDTKERGTARDDEKLLIRQAMARKDWDGARAQIAALRKAYPNDASVAALADVVAAHPAAQEAPDSAADKRSNEEIRASINAQMDNLPTSVRTAAIRCAELGNGAITTYWDLLYNRGRAKERGYTNDSVERQDAQSEWHREETERRMRDGHEYALEKNIIRGRAEDILAINDSPTHAQVLHTPDSPHAQNVVAEACHRNQQNGYFRVKTVVVPENVPHARNQTLVSMAFPGIVRDLRSLQARNAQYRYAG